MTSIQPPGNISPYDRLYIYYLEGVPHRNVFEGEPSFLGCWVEGETSFLFFSQPADREVEGLLRRAAHLRLIESYRMTYREWQGELSLRPVRSGPFVVYPYWLETAPENDRILLPIDPGLVFGTGMHPTTRDCLEAVFVQWRLDPPRFVLDLGCGTGILSLAAARLGDSVSVLAVDANPLCVETARKNVRLNGLERRVQVREGLAEDAVAEAADLLMANLHFEVIDHLVRQPAFYEKRWSILSGLMRSQFETVLRRLENSPIRVVRTWEPDAVWRTVLLRSTAKE